MKQSIQMMNFTSKMAQEFFKTPDDTLLELDIGRVEQAFLV